MSANQTRFLAVAVVLLVLFFSLFHFHRRALTTAPESPQSVQPSSDEPAGRVVKHDPAVEAEADPLPPKAATAIATALGEATPAPVPTRVRVASIPSSPLPVATPLSDVCPAGTVARHAQGEGGREKWCARPDLGGVEVKDGPYLAWWAEGKRRAQGSFVEGRQDGPWVEWFATGVKAAEGIYREGRKEGSWTFWRESGAKAEQGLFREGQKEGRWVVFDDEGHRSAEGEIHSHGQLSLESGKWTWFWPNGAKKEEGVFHEGRRDGKWMAWDPHGKVVSVDAYSDGEKVW